MVCTWSYAAQAFWTVKQRCTTFLRYAQFLWSVQKFDVPTGLLALSFLAELHRGRKSCRGRPRWSQPGGPGI
eukprot:7931350-Alexandrium_andersonii.AAC.1